MKVIKKYKLLEYYTKTVNNDIIVQLEEGSITSPYYDRESPVSLFDSEEEAIAEAYRRSEYREFLIVPIISFDN